MSRCKIDKNPISPKACEAINELKKQDSPGCQAISDEATTNQLVQCFNELKGIDLSRHKNFPTAWQNVSKVRNILRRDSVPLKRQVPFRSNIPKDVNCLEASLGIVIEFYSNKSLAMAELEKISGKESGKFSGTWQAFSNLVKRGFNIKSIGQFDHARFGREGYDYVEKIAGATVAQNWRDNVDLAREQKRAKKAAQVIDMQLRQPTMEDIKKMVDGNKMGIAYVNSLALGGRSGYVGHFVVIVDYNDEKKEVTIHNPGLPPKPYQVVSYKNFQKAWYSPNPAMASLIILEPRDTKDKK